MKITAKTLKGEVINLDIDPEATVNLSMNIDLRFERDD